ncbi:MAG: phenylalanine--tRNA ligase subunit beta [Deltaproteobacteria bacterium]|nr:phenylalanine--tRNA ligase subunit beta [Deltaproteobacteria bacterium]
MIISLNWLENYVHVPVTPEELAHRLTMAGLEVEGLTRTEASLSRVVAGKLEECRPHPDADRLTLCKVSTGSVVYQVVCGAPDLIVGSMVPLALPGAVLPDGRTIGETTVRGQLSQGMLCSQQELGLGADAASIWRLPPDTPAGLSLSQALQLEDVLLDISVTPNRGDCLSVVGVAREVAALCGTRLKYPSTEVLESGPPISSVTSIEVDDPEGCPRYCARVVRVIAIGPSPPWLSRRLEAAGIRSINNVVDVTNFVLLELGQPLHAFDFDRLRERRIRVRRALEGERFCTLDGVERVLFDDTLLICDGMGPVAVAGIMGGLDSEIVPETRNVLIESAYFDPVCIRRSSRKLGLRTESSYRFERGVDPEGVIRALDRAAQLMQELGGGEVATGIIDVYRAPMVPPTITLRVGRTNRFLGTALQSSEMAEALRKIEMEVEPVSSDELLVRPPSFRADITRQVDLAEEIARIIGYERIPVTTPRCEMAPARLDPHLRCRMEIKHLIESAGFLEAITYSFIPFESLRRLGYPDNDPMLQAVSIRNPLSEDLGVMRTSLLPGLLQVARSNFDRGNDDLRLFELSKVFLPEAGEPLPREPHRLTGIMSGRRVPLSLYGSDEQVDFTDIKGAVEEILHFFFLESIEYVREALPPYLDSSCSAVIYAGDEPLGCCGKLARNVQESFDLKNVVYLFELDFDRMYARRRLRPLFQALPRFPSVVRDVALVVNEDVPAGEPLKFIRGYECDYLECVEIFDIFRSPQLGSAKKSLGYRLVYRAPHRSLTDEEVNVLHDQLLERLLKAFDATLR